MIRSGMVWLVNHRRHQVEVWTPGEHVLNLDASTIEGGTVLPGFVAPVSALLI